MLADGPHDLAGAILSGGAAQHRPGVGVEEDAPPVTGPRSEQATCVGGRPPVPFAVPGVAVDRLAERLGPAAEGCRRFRVGCGERRPVPQQAVQEVRHPRRFAASLDADRVQPVVPVGLEDQRQPAIAEAAQRHGESPQAMLAQRRRPAVVERHVDLQGGEVARLPEIAQQHIGQPQQIVAVPGTLPRLGDRLPPVQHDPVLELVGGVQLDLVERLFRQAEQQPDQAIL